MILWLVSGCWLLTGEMKVSEVEASTGPVIVDIPPVNPAPPELTVIPEPCSQELFDAIVRRSEAIAEPLRAKASVLRPICEGDFAYGQLHVEGNPEGGAEVSFLRAVRGWKLLDLGDIDCEMPAEPMTPQICASLEEKWR